MEESGDASLRHLYKLESVAGNHSAWNWLILTDPGLPRCSDSSLEHQSNDDAAESGDCSYRVAVHGKVGRDIMIKKPNDRVEVEDSECHTLNCNRILAF